MHEEELNRKIQELQILEQNLQGVIYQKQNFSLELSGSNAAYEELKDSEEEVFKIVGRYIVKSKKDKVIKEIEEQKEIMGARIKTLETQEKALSNKLNKLREEVMDEINKNKNN